MKETLSNVWRISSVAILLPLVGTQLNCSRPAANSSFPSATAPSDHTCYADGIGCGTPELGAVHISLAFNALPVQTAALMYNNAQQAGLRVDRIGTYWDWFMDQEWKLQSSESLSTRVGCTDRRRSRQRCDSRVSSRYRGSELHARSTGPEQFA